jgi:S-adenosylmethionine decarboxylase
LECKHCVSELYKADSDKLNDEAFVRQALVSAAELAGATLIDVRTHAFEPQGITGFALLAESHISIHTWPEHRFAAVDAFTCGETTNPELACNYLAASFDSSGHVVNFIERSTPPSLTKYNVYQM